MVYRAVAAADLVGGAGLNGAGDVVLAQAHRGLHVLAAGQEAAMAELSVQPVPWLLRVTTRSPAGVTSRYLPRPR